MAKQRTVITKKRRGPKPTGKGTLVGVRLQPPMLKALDSYIADFSEARSRPEAIRLILENILSVHGLLPLKPEKEGPEVRLQKARK